MQLISISGACLSAVIFFCLEIQAQDISEDAGLIEPDGTPSVQVSASAPHPVAYALPVINAKNSQTIAGASLFFGSLAIEWGVLEPWAFRFNAHIAAHHDSVTSSDAGEAMGMLAASMGVGMIQIGGATTACAGASRVYGIYRETVSPDVNDVKVWIPYIIGWAARGAGGALGLIGGLSNNYGLSLTASMFSLAGEAAWTTSTIMSLVYSNRWTGKARRSLSVTPFYSQDKGSGLAISGEF
jgi:hypothetical protein